ncbi:hypothetical protein Rs2_38607 [Raphanus sativus]|nr:hypothetical protein Rs2_38607 [Raphanus sativus]
MVRREGRNPDSTLKGQDSLRGGCSVEMVSWDIKGRGDWCGPWRYLNTSYQYWKYMIRIDRGVCKSIIVMTLIKSKNSKTLTMVVVETSNGHGREAFLQRSKICIFGKNCIDHPDKRFR